jgi:hypothetical protein
MEFTAIREERGYALLANFADGFAVGWKMGVREAFREALDIKRTPRRIGGKTEMLWTQGNLYDFHEGDIFHDSRLAYEDWGHGLKELRLSVQIRRATASSYVTSETVETIADELVVRTQKGKSSPKEEVLDGIQIKRQRIDHGSVEFRVLKPNADRSALVEKRIIVCTQDDFVAFLQTGFIRTKENQLMDLFAENS